MWNNICRGGSCYNMQGRTHVTSPVVQALRGFAPTHSMKTDLYKAQFLRCCSSICFTVNETIKDDSRKVWACTAMCEGDSILWGFTGLEPVTTGIPHSTSSLLVDVRLSFQNLNGVARSQFGNSSISYMHGTWADLQGYQIINEQDSGLFNFWFWNTLWYMW